MAKPKYDEYAAKVAAAMGGEGLAEELVKEHESTRIADYLNSQRVKAGLSMREIAKKMGVSASKVCRIEDSYDRDLSYADIEKYASALGVNVELLFEPRAESKAALSQCLVYRIAGLIEKLKGLVPDPEKFQASADDFAGRALFPVLRSFNV